jgi:DNA-binding IclR family transcriptional regulator
MEPLSLSVNEGFDRLQRLLLAMRAGDDLTVADAAEVTGLNESLCLAVLEGLARAGLMAQDGSDRFVRKSLDLTNS